MASSIIFLFLLSLLQSVLISYSLLRLENRGVNLYNDKLDYPVDDIEDSKCNEEQIKIVVSTEAQVIIFRNEMVHPESVHILKPVVQVFIMILTLVPLVHNHDVVPDIFSDLEVNGALEHCHFKILEIF